MIPCLKISSYNVSTFLQLSPGRDGSDTDMEPTASQSADCEPTPPLQRHGSKSNFFLPPVENNESPRHPPSTQHRHPIHYPRGSPHPRPRYILSLKALIVSAFLRPAHFRPVHRGINGSRSHTPDPLSPETSGSPAIAPQRGQSQGGASPTMQQRIKAIGVPTPLAISSPIRRYIARHLVYKAILIKLDIPEGYPTIRTHLYSI